MPEQLHKPDRRWTIAAACEPVEVYVCEKCRRFGQYRKETLIAKFGADTLRTDVLARLAREASCTLPRNYLEGPPYPKEVCQIRYVQRHERYLNLRADILAGRGVRPR